MNVLLDENKWGRFAADLDVERFWAEDALAHQDNCFSSAPPGDVDLLANGWGEPNFPHSGRA